MTFSPSSIAFIPHRISQKAGSNSNLFCDCSIAWNAPSSLIFFLATSSWAKFTMALQASPWSLATSPCALMASSSVLMEPTCAMRRAAAGLWAMLAMTRQHTSATGGAERYCTNRSCRISSPPSRRKSDLVWAALRLIGLTRFARACSAWHASVSWSACWYRKSTVGLSLFRKVASLFGKGRLVLASSGNDIRSRSLMQHAASLFTQYSITAGRENAIWTGGGAFFFSSSSMGALGSSRSVSTIIEAPSP
mmetsp:Transcript_42093/g.120847  ORF Transcript_42093/g.120847 Transcript_42093/m.120847 type:complete len:250 (-) Transcript_42093:938-1687(-)